MRNLICALGLVAAPCLAEADSARLDQGFEEGCLAIGGAPNFVPVRMSESYYWTFDQAPSISDFRIIRDDTQIYLTVIGRDATCLVFDRIARPDAASVEAALERKFPGAWSRSGDVWAVNGARPMTVRLTSTAGGAGIAVETVN